MAAVEEDGWVHKMNSLECMYQNLHINKETMLVRYCLTLNSKMVISEKQFLKALEYLYRKVPSLRVCTRERDGCNWFKKMDAMKIDFQMKPISCFEEDYKLIVKFPYDYFHGPLWCARLYTSPEAPEAGFTHQYELLFGFSHTISDGNTTVEVLGSFMHILNDVLQNKEVDVCKQIGYFDDGMQVENQISKYAEEYNANPSLFSHIEDLYYKIDNSKVLTLGVFPQVKGTPPRTRFINVIWDKQKTASFLQRCKKEGVTVNNAFSTAANSAFFQILKENGKCEDSCSIVHLHLINARRYWKHSLEFGLGPHIGLFFSSTQIDSSIGSNFWNCAREYQKNIKNDLDNAVPLKYASYTAATEKENPLNTDDSSVMYQTYYITSNMGKIDRYFPSIDSISSVEIIKLERGVQFQNLYNTFFLHCFRGCFNSNFAYGEEFITQEGARQLNDRIFNVLQNAVKH